MGTFETGAELITHDFSLPRYEESYSHGPVPDPAKLAEQYLLERSLLSAPISNAVPRFARAAHNLQLRHNNAAFYRPGSLLYGHSTSPPILNQLLLHSPEHLTEAIHGWYSDAAQGLRCILIVVYMNRYFETLFPEASSRILPLGVGENKIQKWELARTIEGGVWGHIVAEAQSLQEIRETPVTTEDLALQLLAQLGTSFSEGNTIDLASIEEREITRLATAIGMLIQSGAIVVEKGRLIRTERGTHFLQSRRMGAKMLALAQGSSRIIKPSKSSIVPFILGALAGVGLSSRGVFQRAISRVKKWREDTGPEYPPKTTSLSKVEDDEELNDLDYQAYLKEAAFLEQEYGNCIVAYYGGARIAVGKDAKDLVSKLPETYKSREMFIKHIPERKIRLSTPLRVLTNN